MRQAPKREKRDFRDESPRSSDRSERTGPRERIGARQGTVKYSDGETTRLFINLGTKDGFFKASFLQFILDMSELPKDVLGRIDMKEMNSWVEVDKKFVNQMLKAVDGKNYRGRRIRMNDANSR